METVIKSFNRVCFKKNYRCTSSDGVPHIYKLQTIPYSSKII